MVANVTPSIIERNDTTRPQLFRPQRASAGTQTQTDEAAKSLRIVDGKPQASSDEGIKKVVKTIVIPAPELAWLRDLKAQPVREKVIRIELPCFSKSQVQSLTEADKGCIAEELFKSHSIEIPEGVTYRVEVKWVQPRSAGTRRRLGNARSRAIIVIIFNADTPDSVSGRSTMHEKALDELEYDVMTVHVKILKVRNHLTHYLRRAEFLHHIDENMERVCKAFFVKKSDDSNLTSCITLKIEFYGFSIWDGSAIVSDLERKEIIRKAAEYVTQTDRDAQTAINRKANLDRSQGKDLVDAGKYLSPEELKKYKEERVTVEEWSDAQKQADASDVDESYRIVKSDNVSISVPEAIEVDASELYSETIKILSTIDCDTIKNRYESLSPGLEKSLLEVI